MATLNVSKSHHKKVALEAVKREIGIQTMTELVIDLVLDAPLKNVVAKRKRVKV